MCIFYVNKSRINYVVFGLTHSNCTATNANILPNAMNTDDGDDDEKKHAHIIKIASEREHLRMVINKHKTQREKEKEEKTTTTNERLYADTM